MCKAETLKTTWYTSALSCDIKQLTTLSYYKGSSPYVLPQYTYSFIPESLKYGSNVAVLIVWKTRSALKLIALITLTEKV